MPEELTDVVVREETLKTGSLVYFEGEKEPVGIPAGNFLGYGENTFKPGFLDLLWGVPYVIVIEPILEKLGYN